MNSRELIQHPGAESVLRRVSALGQVTTHSTTLPAGKNLMNAVSALMDEAACDSGVLVLDGAQLGPFDYVIPGRSKDGMHAAWYSDTYSCDAARLRNATAIVGRRDNKWWLHCHAIWDTEQSIGMGHLLPDAVTLAEDAVATLYAFRGGRFEVQHDVETAFPLFHAHGELASGNAFIAKVNPHEDIFSAIEQLIIDAGFAQTSVLGIGSLIGAQFESGEPMLQPISEVLIGSGASWQNNKLSLPMFCIDVDGKLFNGNLVRNGAPVTVTFELMVIETPIVK